MIEKYAVHTIDIDNWEQLENLGTKEKFWASYNDQLGLVKFGREGTGENWSEKVACELCALLNLPHAQYELIESGNKQGTISLSILNEGDTLIHGNELLDKSNPKGEDTKAYLQKDHTFSRMMAAILVLTDIDLATYKINEHKEGWHMMTGYLMLDAWIGNTDRHSMNWGLIKNDRNVYSLAPTFDHASSLGRELTDAMRNTKLNTNDTRQSLSAYANKARSALLINKSDKRAMSTIEAFIRASRWAPECAKFWQQKLREITQDQVNLILQKIPDNFITDEARTFALNLLLYNSARILEIEIKK